MFDGPWTFSIDMGLSKSIKITERHTVLMRMQAFNALNHATFWAGDQNINDPTFGVVAYTLYAPRRVQFGLEYSF